MTLQIPDFSQSRVLVVGDVMLDRYWYGGTQRISPEAPVPVVNVNEEEGRPGGAGNVALNIAHIGGQAHLLGLTGQDENADKLSECLSDAGVNCHFQTLAGFPTITKLRVMSRHQQLIRLDFEQGFDAEQSEQLQQPFDACLEDVDLVILSDYGKGTLSQIQNLIQTAKKAGKKVLIDPKGTDFSRYQDATLITPNLSEFEAVVGHCADDAEVVLKGEALRDQHGWDALLVTRGEKGMTLLEKGKEARHLPTHAREVYDVTGAGDTVISTLATALAAGQSLETATQLSNVAAGIVVGKLGTASASQDEIRHVLAEHRVVHRGIISEDELVLALDAARQDGETIVMTNGCFDILHAGHVTYLQEASRLGDRLVVGVNIDETITALKGADRPVNNLERRMTMLAALGCVDWVVAFSEDTPERMICRLQPDFLVKGGDNDPDKIPGAKCVRESGGQVTVMSYLDNCSTTGMIADIRGSESS